MSGCHGAWLRLSLIILVIGGWGCQREPDKKPPANQAAAPQKTKPESTSLAPAESKPAERVAEQVQPAKPAPVKQLPQVAMSQELLETCLVKVGDVIPDAEIADLQGAKQRPRALLGKSLTVLFLWNSSDPRSPGGLEDLQADFAQPLAAEGVAVVAVHCGDQVEAAKAIAQKAQTKFPVLLDTDGAYLAKLAKEKLPRTYLLDAEGKILWFDVEYTRTTQRDLKQAIQFVLGKES